MELNAANCSALSCIVDLSNVTKLEELQLTNCEKLQDVPGLEHLRSLRRVYIAGCNTSASAVRKRLSKLTYEKLSYLGVPGSQIPDWFYEEAVIFSSRVNTALKSVIVGVVLSVKTELMVDAVADSPLSAVQVKIWRTGRANPLFSTALSLTYMPRTCEDQLYLCRFKDFHRLVSLLEDGDKVEVSMAMPWLYASSIELKRRGVFLGFVVIHLAVAIMIISERYADSRLVMCFKSSFRTMVMKMSKGGRQTLEMAGNRSGYVLDDNS